jgi:hypothetical protein
MQSNYCETSSPTYIPAHSKLDQARTCERSVRCVRDAIAPYEQSHSIEPYGRRVGANDPRDVLDRVAYVNV